MLGYAVRQFFDNGGSDAYVLRVTENDTATAACSIDDLDIEASSPARLTESIREGLAKMGKVIRDANIKAD